MFDTLSVKHGNSAPCSIVWLSNKHSTHPESKNIFRGKHGFQFCFCFLHDLKKKLKKVYVHPIYLEVGMQDHHLIELNQWIWENMNLPCKTNVQIKHVYSQIYIYVHILQAWNMSDRMQVKWNNKMKNF